MPRARARSRTPAPMTPSPNRSRWTSSSEPSRRGSLPGPQIRARPGERIEKALTSAQADMESAPPSSELRPGPAASQHRGAQMDMQPVKPIRPGDVIDVRSGPGGPSRRGVVVQVCHDPEAPAYKMAWTDGTATLLYVADRLVTIVESGAETTRGGDAA